MEERFQRCGHDAAAQGRMVLLSIHLLHEVERLRGAVTINKDGQLVEPGMVAQMRHLAASRITPSLGSDRIAGVSTVLDRLGIPLAVSDEGWVGARVAGAEFNTVQALALR